MLRNKSGGGTREETEIPLLQQDQEQQHPEPDAFSPTTTTRAEEADDPLPLAPVVVLVDDDHQDDDGMESKANPQTTDAHTDDTNEEEEPMTTEDPEPLVPFHQPLGDHSNDDDDTSDHHHNQEQEPKEEETPLVSSIYNEIHGSLGNDESQQLHPHETIVDLDTRQEQEQPVVDCRLVEEKEEPDTPETQREPLHLDTNNNMEDERHPILSGERNDSVEEEKDDNDANEEEDDDDNEHEMEDPQSHKVPGEDHVFSLEEWFACPDDWFAAHGPCVECRSTNCFVQDTVVSAMTHHAAKLHQVHHTQLLHNYLERIREEMADAHRQEAAHALLLHLRQQQQVRQQRHWERRQKRRRLQQEEEERQQQQQAKRLQLRPIPILARFANLATTTTTTSDETTDPDDNFDEELDSELDASTSAEYDLTDEEFDLLLHQLETEPIFEELEPDENETTVDARWDQDDDDDMEDDDDEDLDETDWIIPPHDFSIDFPRLVLSPAWKYHSNTTIENGRLTGLQLWDLGEELDQRDTQLLLDASEPSLVLQSRFLEEEDDDDDDEYEQDELNVTNHFHDQHPDGSSATRPIVDEVYDELEDDDDEEEEEELNEGDVWILTESNEYAPASTL